MIDLSFEKDYQLYPTACAKIAYLYTSIKKRNMIRITYNTNFKSMIHSYLYMHGFPFAVTIKTFLFYIFILGIHPRSGSPTHSYGETVCSKLKVTLISFYRGDKSH